MGQAIFVTGDPRTGKTTLIKRLIARLSCPMGGFYTQEILVEGQRRGFEIVTLDGQNGILAHVDYVNYGKVGKYGVDISIVDKVAVQSILAAIRARELVIIDEIGPMEVLSENFCDAVMVALRSPVYVVGTIVKRPTPFADDIKLLANVTVIDVGDVGLGKAETLVLDLLNQAGHLSMQPAK